MKLFPRIEPKEITTRSERDVAQALADTLDDEWSCYHSYSWLRRERFLEAGEIDFILLHRRYGMLVLEVKGGDVSYDNQSGHWWQNGEPMKNPFTQAQSGLHALKDAARARFVKLGEFPCTFGYGVVFPDSNYQGTVPPGAHGAVLYGARDLPALGERVRETLRAWARDQRPTDMVASDYDELRRALQSTFRLVPSLSRELDQDEETLVRLTEAQAEGLARIYANPRVLVEGTAGSGKTMMALERARSFARQGLSALLLCYNRKLADWLKRHEAERLTVMTYHELVETLCRRAGLEYDPPREKGDRADHFWRHTCAELLLDATDLVSDRFDALVVDEGQDFHDEWWMGLEALQRNPGGPLYVFYDPEQNIYGTGMDFPQGMRYQLDENCRNTQEIVQVCGRVLGRALKTRPHSPVGVAPEVVGYRDQAELNADCEKFLKKLLHEDGLHPSRLAILSWHRPEKSLLKPRQTVLSVADWEAGKGIWFSSIRAFKGLESEYLVLVDIEEFKPGYFERRDLHIACSRARHRLRVYTNAEEVRACLLS